MKKGFITFFSLFFTLAWFGLSGAADPDIKGSKDHPLISRMPNFHITQYKDAEFDAYTFFDQDKKKVRVEGHLYSIRYGLDKEAEEPGELKIRRNYQDALKKIGGQVIYDDSFNRVNTILLKKGGKETWVEVRCYSGRSFLLTIIEKEIMQQEIVANAEAMGNDISTTGHVSIYGIYFDTGKSEIKPDSDAAMAEIVKLLNNNSSLKIYVVGHTDNAGTFDSNMKLSKDRADAVAKALIDNGIAADRLKSYGVSSLNPIATNKTEDGKAKNRRVELVEQ